MVVILSLLLLFAVAGLAGLAIYCVQLHQQVAQFNDSLASQQAQSQTLLTQQQAQIQSVTAQYQTLAQKYNDDAQKWNDYALKLQAENQHLARWRGIANADAKAAEMLHTAKLTIERATAEANQLVVAAQQRACIVETDAQRRAAVEIAAADEAAKRTLTEAREKSHVQKDESQSMLSSPLKNCCG